MENLEEYLESYYDIVEFITNQIILWDGSSAVVKRYEEQGRGGMYELAKEWTDIFMRDYEGVNWGEELEYYEVMETFLNDKNKE